MITERRAEFGGEYRDESDGPHPVEPLREDGRHEGLGYYAAAREAPTKNVA